MSLTYFRDIDTHLKKIFKTPYLGDHRNTWGQSLTDMTAKWKDTLIIFNDHSILNAEVHERSSRKRVEWIPPHRAKLARLRRHAACADSSRGSSDTWRLIITSPAWLACVHSAAAVTWPVPVAVMLISWRVQYAACVVHGAKLFFLSCVAPSLMAQWPDTSMCREGIRRTEISF